MASGPVRDLEDLAPGVLLWLRRRHPDRTGLRLASLRHASAGFSNETVVVGTTWDAPSGPTSEALVLRLPPVAPTFPDADLEAQGRVQAALAAAGLPTPVPVVVEDDDRWLGTPFVAMPFVEGRVGPTFPAGDPWLLALPAPRQRALAERFQDLLGALHRVDPGAGGVEARLRHGSLEDEVAWWSEYLSWACDGADPPGAIRDLLTWCRTACPTRAPAASLLWGDPRLGNVIVDRDLRVVAALDWDMAFLGPAEHDLAWYVGLDEVGAALAGRRVPGFASRDETLARAEALLGRRLADFEWYEVFALVRSLAVSLRQSRLAAAAGVAYPVPPPEQNPVVPYVEAMIGRIDRGRAGAGPAGAA